MKQTLASSYAEPRPPRASPAPALRPPQAAGDGAGPGADLAVLLAPDRRHLPAPQQHLQPVPADVGHRHAGLRHGAGHHRRRDRPVSGIAAGPAGRPGRHPDGEPGLEHLAGGGRRAGRRRRVGPGQRLPHDAAARAVLHRRPGRHAGLSRTAAAEHGQRHHRPRARRSGRHRPGPRAAGAVLADGGADHRAGLRPGPVAPAPASPAGTGAGAGLGRRTRSARSPPRPRASCWC